MYFSEFVDKSLENYKEFERKKDSDLMKILKDHVAFQTKYAQKVGKKLKVISIKIKFELQYKKVNNSNE